MPPTLRPMLMLFTLTGGVNMEALLIVVGSLALGALLATLFVYPFLKVRFDAQLADSVRQSREQTKEETLKRSSVTIKGQLGERFAPFVPGFGYEPAEARFLGSPVDYVVFDGLTEGEIRAIAFVEGKTGGATLSPYQRQGYERIKAGRVGWGE